MSPNRAADLRRRLLTRTLAIAALAPFALLKPRRARSADLPLLDPSAPEARKVHYVANAAQAQGAAKGTTCSTCGLYQGADGSKQGGCQLFGGKAVLAAGWCSSWQPQM